MQMGITVVHALDQLRRAVQQLRNRSFEQAWALMEREAWCDWREIDQRSILLSARSELLDVLQELDAVLPEFEISSEVAREFHEGKWTIGREFEVEAPRKILRGFLVPVREVSSDVQVTLKVFAFLTINNSKDILDRHLHQGIHYHYALPDGRHTTTMICWDTRWIPNPKSSEKIRPLFHELHGKGAKSAVAKPERWGDKKRNSIRDACKPDLSKWPIKEFRCASNGSSPVWPTNVVLTPRSAPTVNPKRTRVRG